MVFPKDPNWSATILDENGNPYSPYDYTHYLKSVETSTIVIGVLLDVFTAISVMP